MSNAVPMGSDASHGWSSRRLAIAVAVAILFLGGVFLLGFLAGRDTSMHRYTYTGPVAAVCSRPGGGTRSCFAVTPDPGSARRDGYYAGRLGGPFSRTPRPDMRSIVDAMATAAYVAVNPGRLQSLAWGHGAS